MEGTIDKTIYFDGYKILPYDCLFNYILSNRSAGKTYWGKKWFVDRFKKKGEQFLYLRRYKEDVSQYKIDRFWNNLIKQNEFPNDVLTNKKKNLYINDKFAGIAMPLVQANSFKGDELPNIWNIVYDEFLSEDKHHPYLPTEIENFFSIYNTIARPGTKDEKPVRVFFFANSVSFNNPYFDFWGVKEPRNQKGIYRQGEVLIQYYKNEAMLEKQKQSRYYKAIEGTRIANYQFDNQYLNDNETFVEKRTGKCEHKCVAKCGDKYYGCWFNIKDSKVFITSDYIKDCKFVFCFRNEDHNEHTQLVLSGKKPVYIQYIIDRYKEGRLYFSSISIKQNFMKSFYRLL